MWIALSGCAATVGIFAALLSLHRPWWLAALYGVTSAAGLTALAGTFIFIGGNLWRALLLEPGQSPVFLLWPIGVFAICMIVTKQADRSYWASVNASNAKKAALAQQPE
ncbi:hypothetical protein ACI2UY_22345 [Ralstonia nicotianae]